MPNRKTKAILKPMATQSIPTASEIKAIRKRLGLSQSEAARRVGVSWRTWARWEAGSKIPPIAIFAFDALEHVKA